MDAVTRTEQKLSFWSIYKRNVKGVWNALTAFTRWYPVGPLTVVVQFLLLPLTATLGAGIKTMIDYHDRQPIDKKEFNETLTQLQNMPLQKIEAIANQITKCYPNPKSKSSKALFNLMKNQVDEAAVRKEVAYKFKLNKINAWIADSKTKGIIVPPGTTVKITLSDEEKDEIVKTADPEIHRKKNKEANLKRFHLVQFFNSPRSIGKEMQRRIQGFADLESNQDTLETQSIKFINSSSDL